MWNLHLVVVVTAFTAVSAVDEGKFWFVTDYHYDFTYGNEGRSCWKPVPRENRGDFGNSWCDSPWKLVNHSVYAMRSIEPNVDFIFWTGDNVLHTKNETRDLSKEMVLEMMGNVTDLLVKAFPNITTYPSYGNHDYFPNGQFPVIRSEIYRRMARSWAVWVTNTDVEATLRKGGYYTVLIRPGLRLVSLNTNLYYTRNRLVKELPDPAGQFEWLDSVLAKASSNQEKVIIIGHVPPGVRTPKGFLWYYPKHNEMFNKIIPKYTDIIVAMHFGHDHEDGFKVYYNSRNEPAIPVFIAPAITPWRRYVGPTMMDRARNPGVRLVKYDRATGRHIDYTQYYLDLDNANTEGRATWQVLYTATTGNNIDDISAGSLSKLREKMFNSDTHLQNYFKRMVVGGDTESKCEKECRIELYCGMRRFDLQEYNDCVNKQSLSLRYSASVIITLVSVTLTSCFLA